MMKFTFPLFCYLLTFVAVPASSRDITLDERDTGERLGLYRDERTNELVIVNCTGEASNVTVRNCRKELKRLPFGVFLHTLKAGYGVSAYSASQLGLERLKGQIKSTANDLQSGKLNASESEKARKTLLKLEGHLPNLEEVYKIWREVELGTDSTYANYTQTFTHIFEALGSGGWTCSASCYCKTSLTKRQRIYGTTDYRSETTNLDQTLTVTSTRYGSFEAAAKSLTTVCAAKALLDKHTDNTDSTAGITIYKTWSDSCSVTSAPSCTFENP